MTLRVAPHTLTYLQLIIHKFCIINAISVKLQELFCEIYIYVEIMQVAYYSDRLIMRYKESTRFTGTTLVFYGDNAI